MAAEAPTLAEDETDAVERFIVRLLDMGDEKYGDCIVVQIRGKRILIDAGHVGDTESISTQLRSVLRTGGAPVHFDLVIVTHTHQDHIGCMPTLVQAGVITADWVLASDPDLGWGSDQDGIPDALRIALAGLRDEGAGRNADDATVWRYLLDGEKLQKRYRTMLDTLRQAGSRVVLFRGVDDVSAEYVQLVNTFRAVGMEILAPTRGHLDKCAEVIHSVGRDALDAARSAMDADGEGGQDAAALYRRLAFETDWSTFDIGAALNCQSIITLFTANGKSALLTGDMQLAKPGISGLIPFMKDLRETIADHAPFDLVKIPHHASDNAFNAGVLEELEESRLFTISTGNDPNDHHPDPDVLNLLKQHDASLQWARTDRNGRITFYLHENPVRIGLRRGALNDATPNGVDSVETRTAPLPEERTLEPLAETAPPATVAAAADGTVEITARIPHATTRVTITVDVQPGLAIGAPPEAPQLGSVGGEDGPFEIGGGRLLKRLLVATSTPALKRKIGVAAVERILAAVSRGGHILCDVPAESARQVATAARTVRERLRSSPGAVGVLLLGGYDILPALRLDVLHPALRQAIDRDGLEDPDDFVVWSDDGYADTDNNGFPELPVSRIPDGGSASFMRTALSAGAPAADRMRSGVRNIQRPFADAIFDGVPGTGALWTSRPTEHTTLPPQPLQSRFVYLMLHGDHEDASSFYGEGVANPAVTLANVDDARGAVVFTGCCWGALPVREPAGVKTQNGRITPHTARTSIALRFLEAGAVAFVGCTGAHYSPSQPPYRYAGGPLHDAFWRRVREGVSPAEALYRAKAEYVRAIPHGRTGNAARAVEIKVLFQYTCLGLGW
jgi:beta-lactamase superfamily II metal-dependent hydrolase